MDIKERMKRIIQTESPEVVAQLMADMAEHIASQKSEIESIRAENARREQMGFNIEEKLKLIRRSIFARSSEKRSEASDRPRSKSQAENLLFSQAMFPTDEVRDVLGKTIKTRWADLDTQEIEVPILASELEEEARLRGIEKHPIETWSDVWEEIPGAYERVTKIEIIERRYVKKIFKKKKKKKKYKLNEGCTKMRILGSGFGHSLYAIYRIFSSCLILRYIAYYESGISA